MQSFFACKTTAYAVNLLHMSTYLANAIEIVGGQTALAKRITSFSGKRISQGHVWCWLNRDNRVPPEYCFAIEKATDGRVTKSQLRPDIFGDA